MIRTVIKNYASLTFTLEAETVAVSSDFTERNVRVRLCAETAPGISGTVSADMVGILSVFGSSYALPLSFPLDGSGKTVVSEHIAAGVGREEHPSAAVATVRLCYSAPSLGVYPCEPTCTFGIGRIRRIPEARLLFGTVDLKGPVTILSGMPEEGYEVHCALYDGARLLAEGDMRSGELAIPTVLGYINPHGDTVSFRAEVRVSASLAGTPLPETLSLSLTLKIADGECLPEAFVHADIVYTDAACTYFGAPLRSRSHLEINIPGYVVYTGAHIAATEVYVDGVRKEGMPVRTGDFTLPGEHSWRVRVVDTRGLERVYSDTFTVLDYAPPGLTVTAKRTDVNGTECSDGRFIRVKADVTERFLTDKGNTYVLSGGYVKAGSGMAETPINLTDGSTTVVAAEMDPSFSYEVSVRCTDSAGSVTERTVLLRGDRVEINVAENKVGIGKYATENNLLDCAWSIRTFGDLTFSDAGGEEKSLRDFYTRMQYCVPCNLEVVTTQGEIGALGLKYNENTLPDGGYLIILLCRANGLSFSYGVHLLFCFKDAEKDIFFIREFEVNDGNG